MQRHGSLQERGGRETVEQRPVESDHSARPGLFALFALRSF